VDVLAVERSEHLQVTVALSGRRSPSVGDRQTAGAFGRDGCVELADDLVANQDQRAGFVPGLCRIAARSASVATSTVE
jgi:hypothetical protein